MTLYVFGMMYVIFCFMTQVTIYSGPRLNDVMKFGPPLAKKMAYEYGDLEMCVEVVKNVEDAVKHIHQYGSSHTDTIVTDNGKKID